MYLYLTLFYLLVYSTFFWFYVVFGMKLLCCEVPLGFIHVVGSFVVDLAQFLTFESVVTPVIL